jgi:WD40 repeat protein
MCAHLSAKESSASDMIQELSLVQPHRVQNNTSSSSSMKLPARVSQLLIFACLMGIIISPVSALTEVSFIQQTIKPSYSKPQPIKPAKIQVKESELAKYTDIEEFGLSYRSRDYGYIAYRTKSGNIQVRSLKDPSNDVELPISGFASHLAFSNDDKRLAVAIEKTANLVSIETKETLATLEYTEDVKSINFLQDSKYAVLETEIGAALWNLETNSVDYLFSIEAGIPFHSAVSPDSNYILLYSQDKKVKVWDLVTKAEVAEFSTVEINDSSDRITVKFSDDNKYVTVGGWSGSIKLVDLTTGKEIQFQHFDSLNQLAISSDNKYMISASFDGFIKIFDLRFKAQLGGHRIYYQIDELTFQSSSSVLVFASQRIDGELNVYSLDLYQ